MAKPSHDVWLPDYRIAQEVRVEATLARILGRAPKRAVSSVPGLDSLSLHDARTLQATVMFLDICSFSARVSETQEDQFILMRALALFMSEMIRIIEDHGGVVEKNTGDGLMAYFPKGANAEWAKAPIAASLTCFAANRTMIDPILRGAGLAPFQFRIAMDSGAITVAKIGAPHRFSALVAVGTAANIASKLLGLAERDGLLIGDAVLAGLPLDWKTRFVRTAPVSTGWRYGSGGPPYPAWRYTGRWSEH